MKRELENNSNDDDDDDNDNKIAEVSAILEGGVGVYGEPFVSKLIFSLVINF